MKFLPKAMESLLRPGITGFCATKKVDFGDFRRAVINAARSSGATVVSSRQADCVTPNFHQVDIDLGSRPLSVICNRNYPVVALVSCPIAMSGVLPVDDAEFITALTAMGWKLAKSDELIRPLTAADLACLSEMDRKQAKYWKPARIADVIFNWWD